MSKWFKRPRTETQTHRTTIEEVMINGRELTIEFDRVTTYAHDPNYGADADGNRGMAVDFIDEDRAEAITVDWADDLAPNKMRGEVPLMDLPPEEREEVNTAIDAYLKTYDPDYEPDHYNGPDTLEEWRGER